jgi:hypothetical protein
MLQQLKTEQKFTIRFRSFCLFFEIRQLAVFTMYVPLFSRSLRLLVIAGS